MRIALLVLVVSVSVSCGGRSTRAFNAVEWKKDHDRQAMVADLIAHHLQAGAAKQPLYDLLGWPEIVSGSDYDFSRTWIYCLRREEEDAFMSHARCTRELDIIFSPPNQTHVQRVSAHPATHP